MGAMASIRPNISLRDAARYEAKDDMDAESEDDMDEDARSDDGEEAQQEEYVDLSELIPGAQNLTDRQLAACKSTHPVIRDIYLDTRVGIVAPFKEAYSKARKAKNGGLPIQTKGCDFPPAASDMFKQNVEEFGPPPIDYKAPFEDVVKAGYAWRALRRDAWVEEVFARSAAMEAEVEARAVEMAQPHEDMEAVKVLARMRDGGRRAGMPGGIVANQRLRYDYPAGNLHQHGW
eukprot:TRINITY_DN37552_c0_g1_i1.p2 TRINITY_DN37552_c0_g1~~TRINITY_DN37552_c0_g1_i1.p2  ORF type:complete len:264 (+),score=60.25 TRINITY_DN37552_c0_g1_i1:94-792(+)